MKIPVGYNIANPDSVLEIDTRKHTLVLGKSGVGKSTLLFNILVQYMREGLGFTLLDPHGELVDQLLDYVPKKRAGDIVIFDPKSRKVIGINLLNFFDKELSLDTLITIIKAVWPDGWGPQSDFIATNLFRAVIEVIPNPTALHGFKILFSRKYRNQIRRHVTDPVVLQFLQTFDNEWDDRQRETASAPLMNKIGKFAGPLLRVIIGQQKGIDMARIMDGKKVLLCRLSKGALGADISSLLGSMIVALIQQAALQREKLPPNKRVPHLLAADEVHTFTKGVPIDVILSEARKYNLNLILASQFSSQIPKIQAVFGNVNTIIAFRVSGDDAEQLEKEFGSQTQFTRTAIQSLNNFEFWMTTVSEAGTPIGPVKLRSLLPLKKTGKEANKERIYKLLSNNYGDDRKEVEGRVNAFLRDEENIDELREDRTRIRTHSRNRAGKENGNRRTARNPSGRGRQTEAVGTRPRDEGQEPLSNLR